MRTEVDSIEAQYVTYIDACQHTGDTPLDPKAWLKTRPTAPRLPVAPLQEVDDDAPKVSAAFTLIMEDAGLQDVRVYMANSAALRAEMRDLDRKERDK